MTLDTALRNTLRLTVIACRKLLEDAVAEALEGEFGVHRGGEIEPAAAMRHLAAVDLRYREQVVGYLGHLQARGFAPAIAVGLLVREVAFTHLNRLCAYKLLERRKLLRETVSRGLKSNGFLMYLADHPDDERLWSSGGQDLAYRRFLLWTAQTLATEMPALFSVHDPANRLFPSQRILDAVLAQINAAPLESVWDEDEAIGWIYQYFTPKELRDEARKASAAPRNSYEMAFRNQFYTPRYVVEFLVDNTLGRQWYEMTRGQTALATGGLCASMLRKPHPIWLTPGEATPEPFSREFASGDDASEKAMWTRPNPELSRWMPDMVSYALTVDGYSYARRLRDGTDEGEGINAAADLANSRATEYRETGVWRGGFEELRVCLFFEQRRWRHADEQMPRGTAWDALLALHRAVCVAWDREAEVIPYRAKVDPRELRILDPACGSGHFLLYAFDLLSVIYREAYTDDALGPALQAEYPSVEAYHAAIPGMILRHNLHGVDIDLRAIQIAGLALWLRAQREYVELGIPRDTRPPIRRANLVYAEPMPGEYALLRDFLITLEPPALMGLVEDVWGQMKLAGEVGSLLQVERALRESIGRAKREWIRTQGGHIQLTLLAQATPPVQQALNYAGVDDVTFFETEAEPRVLDALRRFAGQRAGGGGASDDAETTANDPYGSAADYTRQLFVDDAARGFALIELLERRYSVVLMNPPFGDPSLPAKPYIEKTYPRTKNDIYAAFVERGLDLLRPGGRLGAITSRTGFFLTSFQKWREDILLTEAQPIALADLGYGVLDTAMVETAAYVLEKVR